MRYLPILLAAVSLILVSCEGPTGEQGPPGDDGVANIQTLQVSWESSDISWRANGNAEVTFNLEQITSVIADSGAVMAYYDVAVNPDSSSNWLALPYVNTYDSNENGDVDTTVELTYSYQEGGFSLLFYYDGPDEASAELYPTGTVKIVLIPPSEAAEQMKDQSKVPYGEIEPLFFRFSSLPTETP